MVIACAELVEASLSKCPRFANLHTLRQAQGAGPLSLVASNLLHAIRAEARRIRQDRKLVSPERRAGEDIEDVESIFHGCFSKSVMARFRATASFSTI